VCPHQSQCPPAEATDREAARVVASHPEQGWSLLCNGVVLFDDTGELLPDGSIIAPHRPTDRWSAEKVLVGAGAGSCGW
jgi:hypothetical protein